MKLTLSTISSVIERRYKLDEPVVVTIAGADYRVHQFVTITRTYEYGETEHEYLVRGRVLKKDGTPDQREEARDHHLRAPAGEFAELLPDPRKPFIDALWAAIDKKENS